MCVAELTVRAERIAANEFWVSDGPAGPTGLYELIVDADDLAPGVGELHLIFVEPETIGSGLGRRLWQHMEDRARARDIAVIGLDADPNALPFYERMGCRRVGQSPSGSVPGRMLPRLEKRLDGRPGSN
jgi:GNAT superfamily N-acetyltransferase